MSKKKKSNKRKQRANRPSGSRSTTPVQPSLRMAAESRTALSVTVAWTLSLMATLGAESIGLFCKFYVRFVNANELLTVLGVVMLLVALTAGCATLILTPVAVRISKTPPPQIIVQLAYVAGALPLLTLLLQYLTTGAAPEPK